MLADLTKFNCPKNGPPAAMKQEILKSAKLNLAKLPMFGLNEHLFATQYLLKWSFNLKFKKFMPSRNSTHVWIKDIEESDLEAVKQVNRYDTEFYKFSEKLFLKRLKYVVSYDKKRGYKIPAEVEQSLDTLQRTIIQEK